MKRPSPDDVRVVGEERGVHVFRLHEAGERVMRDLARVLADGTDVDRPDPARFGEAGRRRSAATTRPARPAGIVYSGDFTMRSGGAVLAGQVPARSRPPTTFGGGMSFGSPFGAPAATHCTIVSICSSLSERSFLNFWMPTVLSMCHGGICRAPTRAAIDLRPRPRLFVGHERHRRHVVRPMARFAFLPGRSARRPW